MPASIGVFRNSDGSPPLLMVLTDEPVTASYMDGTPIPLLDEDCMVSLTNVSEGATEVRFRIAIGTESRTFTAHLTEPEPESEPAPKPKRSAVEVTGGLMMVPAVKGSKAFITTVARRDRPQCGG